MFYLDHRLTIIIGAYGSGKSEIAVNMSLAQRKALPDRKLLIADLDIVNPFYRSSDCASVLEEAGIPTENFKTGIDNVDEALKKASADVKNFAKDTKSTTAYMDLFSKDAKKSSSAIMQMNQSMSKISQN